MRAEVKSMSSKITKEFLLEGLNCASCAGKIELNINELENVTLSSINFITKTLTIELSNADTIDEIIKKIHEIVNKFEPHVIITEKTIQTKEISQKNQNSQLEHKTNISKLVRIGIGAAFFVIAITYRFPSSSEFILYLISYVLIGGEFVFKATRNIFRGQLFDENFLMSIATIGAFAIGEFAEGVAVMLFFQIGEALQDYAVNRSRKSITALMDIRPDYANLKFNGYERIVAPEEVNIGDIIIVKPGEKIPLDGQITEGRSMVDTSALTGESVPREVYVGSDVLSGFVNKNGLINIKVAKEFQESTVSKILKLVETAGSRKAPTEKFITKFARYYTPLVVFVALSIAIIPPIILKDALFSEWIYRSLIFLVASCPCALLVSIPLSFFGGIGAASKNGILIKGGNYLEALNNIDTVVFDKTGTLTKGVFKVTKIKSVGSFSEQELLEIAAYSEVYSNHPIATSIVKAYGKEIEKEHIKNYQELPGNGMKVEVNGKEVLVGNKKLMLQENIAIDDIEVRGTVVYIAVCKAYAGYIVI